VGGLVLTFLLAAVAPHAARRRLSAPVAAAAFGVEKIFRVIALLSPILAGERPRLDLEPSNFTDDDIKISRRRN
jgi:hypothetical protein